MFDHLTTPDIRAHVARLQAAIRRPTGMAYPHDEYASDLRELAALEDELRARASSADHFHACARCGQTVITRADPPICQACRALEREPQGQAMRLFEPAPAQIAGQLNFSKRGPQ